MKNAPRKVRDVTVHIEILQMNGYRTKERGIEIGLPVIVIECAASPPLDKYLDPYEEAVLKLVSIGLSTRGISGALNATESFTEVILNQLESKKYAVKDKGAPWKLTENGEKYISGYVEERESEQTEYGYMFINGIKREVMPYFLREDIKMIPRYRGEKLPEKLTLEKDERKTFGRINVKQAKLREAYRNFIKNMDAAGRHAEGEISHSDAEDVFAELETFDEAEVTKEPERCGVQDPEDKMFIRRLEKPQINVYLTMKIIIDPKHPGGYRVESPFNNKGLDNRYFQSQVQWLAAMGKTYIGEREFGDFLTKEVIKISPKYRDREKDFSVFVLERIPLLMIMREQFGDVYDYMSQIYPSIQNSGTIMDRENTVGNISRYIVEKLFNEFFTGIGGELLEGIASQAMDELKSRGIKGFKERILHNTGLEPSKMNWDERYVLSSIARMRITRGNSIIEKLINITILNYYCQTKVTEAFLSRGDIGEIYIITDKLNQIRRKVSHDTSDHFEEQDYEWYMENVYKLINSLLEAYKED